MKWIFLICETQLNPTHHLDMIFNYFHRRGCWDDFCSPWSNQPLILLYVKLLNIKLNLIRKLSERFIFNVYVEIPTFTYT